MTLETIQGKSTTEWLDWLEVEGKRLAACGVDVRIVLHSDFPLFGSFRSVCPSRGLITLLSYGQSELAAEVPIHDIARLEVLNSRRLTSDRAYQQMLEMEQTLPGRIPVDGTCP